MNILYFYQYFGTPKGGWSTRAYENCKRWVEVGHSVTVISAPYEKSDLKAKGFISKQYFDGIKVIVINVKDSNRNGIIKRLFNFLLFSFLALFIALFYKADVVIGSSGPITVGFPLLIISALKRIPMIFEVRDLWPAGAIEMGKVSNKFFIKLGLWFEVTLYKRSKLVVTASKGMEAHIKKRFPKTNIISIPNASDNLLFGQKQTIDLPNWAKEKNLFLHIGSLGYIHNCIQIINAAKKIEARKHSDILFLFLGDGAERNMLERKAVEYKLENVKFLGLVSKNEVVKWLTVTHATLFTTLNNPIQDTCSPNKIFDSFAAGVPIIQTTQGWIKELIEEEECGLNVLPNDPSNMADAIQLVAENSELRDNLALNAKRVALEKFDRDKLAYKMLKTIEEVVNKK